MDIQLNTLLVALMFVTILSMGIGNILIAMADIFNHVTPSRRDRIHVSWIVLVLLVHFNLFWHTKEILNVDDWTFAGFLLTIAGPVLMFFATSIMLTDPPTDEEPGKTRFFDALGQRFFWMFAALQVWIVAVGVSLTGAFITTDLANVLMFILAVVLATTKNDRINVIGAWVAWGLVLASGAIRWLGI